MRGFLQALRQLCNERGLLLIHDQVQAGLNIPDKVFSPQHRDSVLSH
jgi:acetylornithine/succinyldiaminopimelate/putrescine aminotransferase